MAKPNQRSDREAIRSEVSEWMHDDCAVNVFGLAAIIHPNYPNDTLEEIALVVLAEIIRRDGRAILTHPLNKPVSKPS